MKQDNYSEIFRQAHLLFQKNGFKSTTMRQIAEASGISLGLINHFFNSKNDLAVNVLEMILLYCSSSCSQIYPTNDLLMETSLTTCANTRYLLSENYHRFYVECLESDIFFSVLEARPNVSMLGCAESYHYSISSDEAILFGKYVPYNYEKTLIVGKEQGMFSSIPYEKVPYYIIISKFEHFIARDILEEKLDKANSISEKVIQNMEPLVPDSFVEVYLDQMPR